MDTPSHDTFTEQKNKIRAQAKMIRSAAQQKLGFDAVEKVTAHALDLTRKEPTDRIIALYYPTGSELDSRLLAHSLDRAGYTLALPVVETDNRPMTFRQWAPEDELIPGAFGIMEPHKDAPTVTPNIVFCPLLAFDENCNRIGYGKGYYDRTLPFIPQVRAYGLAFAAQFIETLPLSNQDVPLHAVVTEEGTLLPQKG